MRTRLLCLIGLSLVTVPGVAQNPSPVVNVQDGGTSGTRMESLFVPPLTGAPFSLTLATEWSRPLGNGGNFTLVNQRRIARDSHGRIYQERWILVPKGGKVKSTMDVIQLSDPAQHTLYNCFTQPRVCEAIAYRASTATKYEPAVGATGALPNGTGFHQHESLGVGNTEGVNTTGSRETTTLNAGIWGNDRPMVSTREFWFAAGLGINLYSKVETASTGTQTFTATNLTTSEPDPALFQLPEGYKIVDHRDNK